MNANIDLFRVNLRNTLDNIGKEPPSLEEKTYVTDLVATLLLMEEFPEMKPVLGEELDQCNDATWQYLMSSLATTYSAMYAQLEACRIGRKVLACPLWQCLDGNVDDIQQASLTHNAGLKLLAHREKMHLFFLLLDSLPQGSQKQARDFDMGYLDKGIREILPDMGGLKIQREVLAMGLSDDVQAQHWWFSLPVREKVYQPKDITTPIQKQAWVTLCEGISKIDVDTRDGSILLTDDEISALLETLSGTRMLMMVDPTWITNAPSKDDLFQSYMSRINDFL